MKMRYFYGTIEVLGRYCFRVETPSSIKEDGPMRKASMMLITLIIASLALSACANTVTGVGRDIKQTGHAVKRAVE
jgi:predicted small secreted protein